MPHNKRIQGQMNKIGSPHEIIAKRIQEGVAQNLQLIKVRFTTISSRFFANYFSQN